MELYQEILLKQIIIIPSSGDKKQLLSLKVVSSIILATIAIHLELLWCFSACLFSVSKVPNVPRVEIVYISEEVYFLVSELSVGHSPGLNTHYPSKQAEMLADITVWSRLGTFVFTLNKETLLGRRVFQSWSSVLWAIVWKYLHLSADLNTNWSPRFRAIFFFLLAVTFQQTVAVFPLPPELSKSFNTVMKN